MPYYNPKFQSATKAGSKPGYDSTTFKGGWDAFGGWQNAGLGVLGGVLGATGIVKSGSDRPKAHEFLNYYYGKVGALKAKAEAETDPNRQAKLNAQIDRTKGKVEQYAYKIDKKARPGGKFLPPRTYDEIEAGRKSYLEKLAAGPQQSTRTIKRTL